MFGLWRALGKDFIPDFIQVGQADLSSSPGRES